MRKKLLMVLLSLALVCSAGLLAACGGESAPAEPKLNVGELNFVYDGTAKRPEVTLEPADAGDLYVVLYKNGAKVSEAVDAGTYEVKISVSNADKPMEDVAKQMVISPKTLNLSGAAPADKQYDGSTGYEGALAGVTGVVTGDKVTVTATGTIADKAIASQKTLTVSELKLTGTDAGNYKVDKPASMKVNVVKRQLTISGITVTDRVADETVTAEWTGTPVLENVVDGENVTVTISKIEFPKATSGSHKMIVTAELAGNDAASYELAEDCGVVGKILSATGDFIFDAETGTVTGYSGESSEVVIPETLNGVAVKTIGAKAFTMNDGGGAAVKLTQVDLPAGLLSIGDAAFANTDVESVVIPASVTSIGANAFYYCSKLASVTFASGGGQMTWGSGTFRNTAVTNFTVPAGLTQIPSLCFQDSTGEGVFTIPATVNRIGESAFLRSKFASFVFSDGTADLVCEKQVFAGASMTSFEIPARMVEMGGSFFQNAANLTTLTFASNRAKPLVAHKVEGAAAGFHLAGTAVTSLNFPGSLGVIPDGMANNLASLKTVTIGEGITKIDNYAFFGTSIESIVLPKSLREIGFAAFQASAALKSLTFTKGGTEDLVIGAWSFQACSIEALELPARTVSLGAACFAGNKIASLTFEAGGTKPLVFENGVDPDSKDKGYHFDQCPLTSVVLPKRTVEITLPNVFNAGVTVTYEK